MEKKIQKTFFVFKIIGVESGTANPENPKGQLSSAVNVLTNTPKISNFNKGDILQIIFPQSDQKT